MEILTLNRPLTTAEIYLDPGRLNGDWNLLPFKLVNDYFDRGSKDCNGAAFNIFSLANTSIRNRPIRSAEATL